MSHGSMPLTTTVGEPDVDAAWRIWSELVSLTPEPDREYQRHWAKMIVGGIIARAGLVDSARNVRNSARPPPGLDPLRDLTWLEAYICELLGDHDEAIIEPMNKSLNLVRPWLRHTIISYWLILIPVTGL